MAELVDSNPNNNNNNNPKERRKRKRWGDATAASGVPSTTTATTPVSTTAAVTTTIQTNDSNDRNNHPNTTTTPIDPQKAKILALQASVKARLAAAKAQLGGGGGGVPPATIAKKAKVYDLDLSITAPIKQPETISVIQKQTTIVPFQQRKLNDKQKKSSASSSAATKTSTNPYLAHTFQREKDEDAIVHNEDDAEGFDARLADVVSRGKHQKPSKPLTFVEPGTYTQLAEIKREREKLAAHFASGRKTGRIIHAATIAAAEVYGSTTTTSLELDRDEEYWWLIPPADAIPDLSQMPIVMEWWDAAELLPKRLKKAIAVEEAKIIQQKNKSALQQLEITQHHQQQLVDGDHKNDNDNDDKDKDNDDDERRWETLRTQCYEQASLSYCKTAALVQHIVPIKPDHLLKTAKQGDAELQQPVLHLTKKERKRQRKLRRSEKQRELQDLQAAGLIPAPEPRLTLSNFMRVLGDQGILDPSAMEQKVREQMQARLQAHLQRNANNKLTKEQRAEKRARKYQKETSQSTSIHVALFYIADVSHPYHRTKLDLNARQLNLTGCVIECIPNDPQQLPVALLLVEGTPKAIQRYTRLVLVRMHWSGPPPTSLSASATALEEGGGVDDDFDGTTTHPFNPNNKCEQVWQGLAVKRLFPHGFTFQACESHEQARKILQSKGAAHYWDQVVRHAKGEQQSDNYLPFKLTSTTNTDDQDQNPFRLDDNSEDEDNDIVMKDSS
jgi:U4/U6 small nuclear ribonucleoprotein PRP3